jgi:hypothetical protein
VYLFPILFASTILGFMMSYHEPKEPFDLGPLDFG